MAFGFGEVSAPFGLVLRVCFTGLSRALWRQFLMPLVLVPLVLSFSANIVLAQQNRLLFRGSTVATGFSGTYIAVPQNELAPGKLTIDETFIDPEGFSAQIFLPDSPGYFWDGRQWDLPPYFEVPGRDVGQVFGIAIDKGWPRQSGRTDVYPNVYLSATSAFGVQIVAPDADGNGFAERIVTGEFNADFMQGQFGDLAGQGNMFGQTGGPGSIYKIDGRTREVSLFANITLFGEENSGAGLGNIAFDPVHDQLFVSDRDTGVIHRLDLDGNDLEQFDHGLFGRPNNGLPAVGFDLANRMDITSFQFDSEDPDTWAYARPERLIWGLAVEQGRLYYAVAQGPEIWSVGIDAITGAFLADARWELDVWPEGPGYEISDIVFNAQGAMIVAQRAEQRASYYYVANIKPRSARVYRYWRESPDDPLTPSIWQFTPQEYAIGFLPNHRNPTGGVDLSYGYLRSGQLDLSDCEGSLWATGDSLRINPYLGAILAAGGEVVVQGLQGSPSELVRSGNVPPWKSYMIDYDGRFDVAQASGQLGDVENYHPCGGQPVDIIFGKSAGLAQFDIPTGIWTLGYIFDIFNAGDPFAAQSFIQIGDMPPEGTAITAVSGDNWLCNLADFPIIAPNLLECSYDFGDGIFASGERLPPLQVDVTTNQKGRYRNCAFARLKPRSGLVDYSQDNNRSCGVNDTDPEFDISIEKKAALARPGQTAALWLVDFTLEVTNQGAPIPAGTTIAITDPVPVGMSFVAASGPGWVCPVPQNQFPMTSPDVLSCTFTTPTDVPTGGIVALITVVAQTDHAGRYLNCAQTGFDDQQAGLADQASLQESNYDNNEACATVEIDEPDVPVDVKIEKTVVKLIEDAAVDGSSAYEFTLAVTNVGPAFSAQNAVVVTDTVPAGLSYSAATFDPAVWSCAPLMPPDLASGSPFSCTYVGSGQVAQGDVLDPITVRVVVPAGSGQYRNCASAGFSQQSGLVDANGDNNVACAEIEIVAPPQFQPECGVNVIFVVDVSASIPQNGAAANVNGALNNAKRWFDNTNSGGVPAQGAVITFSDTATVAQPMSAGTFSSYLPLNYGGETNWEAALQLAATEAAAAPSPVIIIFITDGIPNKYIDDTSDNVVSTSDPVLATNQALPHVANIYGQGVPIYGYGIGGVLTHLNALLGTSATGVGFGGLSSALQGLGRQTCSDLYLRKSASPSYINYNNNPGPKKTKVTLVLENTSGAINSVTVKDVLPPELTNPTNFVVSGSATALENPVGTVVWNITNFAANSTRVVSFDVDIVLGTDVVLGCSLTNIINRAQVTASSQPVHSTPNSFVDPMTGPVEEHDENKAFVRLRNCATGGGGTPYLRVSKTSVEGCLPVGQASPAGVASDCTFTVTVRAVGNFSGDVTFGDSVFNDPAGGAVNTGLVAITAVSAPPPPSSQGPYCFEGFTALPSACSQNLVLNSNQAITFDVSLSAPPVLDTGNYLNCFMVKSGPAQTVQNLNFAPYYNSANTSNSWPWGFCGKFSISDPGLRTGGTDGTDGQPDLQIQKIAPTRCEAGRKCVFTVKVTNVGKSGYVGPAFVADSSQTRGVKLVAGASGGGWSCFGGGGSVARCANSLLSLKPGQSSSFLLPLRLPSTLRRNSRFENCAALVDARGFGLDQPVLYVQMMLTALGYAPGPADGVMGQNTRAAIRAFQKTNNMAADGAISAALSRQLATGGSIDPNPNNDRSCASVKVTKTVRKAPPVVHKPAKPTKPKATIPTCEFPNVYNAAIGRCVNVLKLLAPRKGGVGGATRP